MNREEELTECDSQYFESSIHIFFFLLQKHGTSHIRNIVYAF